MPEIDSQNHEKSYGTKQIYGFRSYSDKNRCQNVILSIYIFSETADIDGPPEKKVRSSPTKADLKTTNDEMRKKFKVLQQKIRRQKKKMKTQTELIDELKERKLLDDDVASMLEENFSGITAEVMINQLKNKDRDPRGRRYTSEVKKVCINLRFLLPACI